MASVGPQFPTAGADVTGVGTLTWLNPGNVTADDGSIVTVSGKAAVTHYLQATGFDFSAIPAGATIDGVVVEWKVQRAATGAQPRDSTVSLVVGGSVVGTNKATNASFPSVALTYFSYGSSSDLWGLTPSLADVQASNFGAVLSATFASAKLNGGARVDACRITVYYTAAASGGSPGVIGGGVGNLLIGG